MASPTSPVAISPETREFAFAVESVAAGTPGTVIIHEVAEDISLRWMRKKYQSIGFRKASVTRGKSYVTQRWMELDIKVCYHSAGFGAFALGIVPGNASEGAVTGVGVKTHPFLPNASGNRMNTVTVWFDLGDHNHVLQMVRGTISGWSASVNAEGALEITVTLTLNWPTYTSTVTPTAYVGSTANYPITPVLGSQGTYTIYNGVGTAYANEVLDAALSFQRTVAPLPNAKSLDPADFNAGELVFSGSLHFQYDGLAANSVHDDYMTYANLGDNSTHRHLIGFTNADGHGFNVNFDFLRWEDPSIDFSGEVVTVQAPFSTEPDESQLDQATPVTTAPASINILNSLASAMTS